MKIYYIALGIMIMSASLQITQDMGIFSTPLPYNSYDSAQAKITDMTNSTTLTNPVDDFFGIGIIKAIGYAISALGSAIIIIPLLSTYGVPLAISAPIQGIIYFIYGIGIFQLISGRGIKYYE